MDELNNVTMAIDENEVVAGNEGADTSEETEVTYVDAGLVLAVGAVGGALALKGAQMIWNCKPVKSAWTAVAGKLEDISQSMKARSEERQRKKLAKVKSDVIDAEVVPTNKAANE